MKNNKQAVIEKLKPLKKFIVRYGEEVFYEKEFKASSKEELERLFYNGELDFDEKNIVDGNTLDDSLEIEEC